MSALIRTAAATLVLSAAGLIGMAVSEGWEPVARPPVPGDVPTGGFGSTRSESGPMKEGERIEPVRGLILLQRDAVGTVDGKRCHHVNMHIRSDQPADYRDPEDGCRTGNHLRVLSHFIDRLHAD